MPKTLAIRNFNDLVLRRCPRLVEHHAKLSSGPGNPGQVLGDVLRGTLILACAALDALIFELLCEALPAAYASGLVSAPTGDGPARRARSLVQLMGHTPPAALVGSVRQDLRLVTLQRPDVIDTYVGHALGAFTPWASASAALSVYDPRRVWTPDELRAGLNDLIDRRDRIAHKGDVAAGNRRTTSITRSYVQNSIYLIYEVGRATRDVITQRLR